MGKAHLWNSILGIQAGLIHKACIFVTQNNKNFQTQMTLKPLQFQTMCDSLRCAYISFKKGSTYRRATLSSQLPETPDQKKAEAKEKQPFKQGMRCSPPLHNTHPYRLNQTESSSRSLSQGVALCGQRNLEPPDTTQLLWAHKASMPYTGNKGVTPNPVEETPPPQCWPLCLGKKSPSNNPQTSLIPIWALTDSADAFYKNIWRGDKWL